MPKPRGLPDNFGLKVAAEAPVQLGDYLDDEVEPVRPRPAPVVTLPVREEPRVLREEPRPLRPLPEPPPRTMFRPQVVNKPPPRKQVNMNPQTLRMVEELLDYVQAYGGQNDTKASELFEALVLMLYEAREQLDLSRVPPRGRWGTPTARAFPTALKNAFQAAVARQFGTAG